MIDSSSDGKGARGSGTKFRWTYRGVLAATCALVVGAYAYAAHSGSLESFSLNPADTYYNLLVQGFRAGQLSLKKDVPRELMLFADLNDPTAHHLYLYVYRMLDISYYKGRLYLYFGVTPVLMLFWPYAVLTGHYLFDRQALAIFCAMGFLASAGLLCGLWRRYFAEVSLWVVAACALALGLATGVPVLLSRADVYEVPVGCAYMLTMLALGAIWCASHRSGQRGRWLAAASLAYGLAVGARPSLLFGAVILLVPVARAWREKQRVWSLLMAAVGPITLIGLGLMLYNTLRFDDPLEFGQRYQLPLSRKDTLQQFGLHYLWFDFRVCFLEPARWGGRFPFVHDIAVPPLPKGGTIEHPFGVLTNIPLVWLALTVPLGWRGRSAEARSTLRWFLAAVVVLFGTCALTICLHNSMCFRYEVEFLPTLVLLAVIGILGLERTLAPTSGSGLTDRPVWRHLVRSGWGLLLGFSVVFNVLAAVERYAEADDDLGITFAEAGRLQEAIVQYEQALRLRPDYPEVHNNLGVALERLGRIPEAVAQYEQALRLNPGYPEAHSNLGLALERVGRIPEAIAHYEQALQLKPDFAEPHNALGSVLMRLGRVREAVGHWEQAVRLKPDFAEAHNNLGSAFLGLGKVPEAIEQYEQALRIKPDYALAHYNLGTALEEAGREQEAIGHYEQAVRIKPDFVEAQRKLARRRPVQ